MKFLVGLLLALLLLLQYRLWLSENGFRESTHLRAAVAAQQAENAALERRNRELAAEVLDLRSGSAALEERARNDLGMIGKAETFYQVVPPGTPLSARPGGMPTAAEAPLVPAAAAGTGALQPAPLVPAAAAGTGALQPAPPVLSAPVAGAISGPAH
jgi:cell division protein FtsB